jgi:hypothetical protein
LHSDKLKSGCGLYADGRDTRMQLDDLRIVRIRSLFQSGDATGETVAVRLRERTRGRQETKPREQSKCYRKLKPCMSDREVNE